MGDFRKEVSFPNQNLVQVVGVETNGDKRLCRKIRERMPARGECVSKYTVSNRKSLLARLIFDNAYLEKSYDRQLGILPVAYEKLANKFV